MRGRAAKYRRTWAFSKGIGLGLSVLFLLHCAARTPIEAPQYPAQELPSFDSLPYKLQVGDRLAIRFWAVPEFDQEVVVRPDGKISLPYVDAVEAAGRSPEELDDQLTELYAAELKNPAITVVVEQAMANRVFVGGEVQQQGPVPIFGQLTLVQALQEAGGLLVSARRQQVLVIRTTPSGERLARSIDIRPILSGQNPQLDVPLQTADIVFVPRTRINNVNLFVEQYLNRLIPIGPLVVQTLR